MIKSDLGLKWLGLLGIACNSIGTKCLKGKKETAAFNFNANPLIKHKLTNYSNSKLSILQ